VTVSTTATWTTTWGDQVPFMLWQNFRKVALGCRSPFDLDDVCVQKIHGLVHVVEFKSVAGLKYSKMKPSFCSLRTGGEEDLQADFCLQIPNESRTHWRFTPKMKGGDIIWPRHFSWVMKPHL
jgi:hypothetical protein